MVVGEFDWEGGSPFPPHKIWRALKAVAVRNTAGAETRPPDGGW